MVLLSRQPPPRLFLTLLSTFLLVVVLLPSSTVAKLQPAKRTYDTHTYYVLHLDSSSQHLLLGGATPEEVATALGAEHVERVGELADHYLIRAASDLVERGLGEADDAWGSTGALSKRSGRDSLEKRDSVMEAYDLLRRGSGNIAGVSGHLSKRGVIGSQARHLGIRSLERQSLRLRVKRDLPVLPPQDFAIPSLQEPLLLSHLDKRTPIPSPQVPVVIPVTPEPPSAVLDAMIQFGIQDPIFPLQWHLVNKVMGENSVNITGVWADGVHGKGVTVAMVDDGLDMHSDDLSPNFNAEGSWDYNDNTALPEPRLADDQHGTRCAGEIAAAKNDVCGVGIAYKAGISGIRILSASISDADEASALNYGFQTNDIYSCSWGPPDDGKSMEAPGQLIKRAMLNGVQNGRNGKGNIFVFASGNGGGVDDQCNFDGYTNSLLSITVGAIDRKGLHPFYSEACAAIMVVTYSSGSGDNIHTTDVGKNSCTDRHGGTSAAAPIAAGIFALALEVRPDLTWRDLQHLCVQTAVQINPTDPDWQMTASGRNFNHKYGFGKLDAWAIVDAARRWKLVKPQTWWESITVPSNQALTAEGVTSVIKVSKQDLKDSNFEELEHVTVTVHIQHERRGDVEVELLSPKGMISILARPRRFDEATTGLPNWVFMTVKHWDEDPVGTWTLRVRDRQDNNKNGTLLSWSMQLWGSAIDAKKARLWELPADRYDDEDEENEGEEGMTSNIGATPTTLKIDDAAASATKQYVKPTAHLPEDHAEAPGENHDDIFDEPPLLNRPSHSPLPTSTSASGSSPFSDEEVDEFDTYGPGYLAGMKALVGNSTWLFVAGGTIVIFVGAVSAFFLVRSRKIRRRLLGRGGGSGGDYAFAPSSDEEGTLLSNLGGRLSGGGMKAARTKDLYDAFALGDSEGEDEDDDEKDDKNNSKIEYRDREEETGGALRTSGEEREPLSSTSRTIGASRERSD